MPAEIRIALYVAFAASLFVLPSLQLYAVFGACLAALLTRVPRKTLLSGWVPISLFLLFTFLSNLLGRPGRILFAAGSLVVTDEGLHAAAFRSMRLLLMIMGVKLMMGMTATDDILRGIGRLLKPLERLGLPVQDFVHTMGLTLQCFPALKDRAAEAYRRTVLDNDISGFGSRARAVAGFLMPLFVQSMRDPESFFRKEGGSGRA